MQKIKNAIKGHKADRAGDRADEYDVSLRMLCPSYLCAPV